MQARPFESSGFILRRSSASINENGFGIRTLVDTSGQYRRAS
jgi:hypothetical protein